MNILHILSQIQPTGAEYYAVALAKWQISKGNNVYIVSDTLRAQTQAEYLQLPISEKSFFVRLHNVKIISKFIDEKKIDVVHSHSRAAAHVAYRALKNKQIPLISTIHGRQHIHLASKLRNPYGDRIITVCENLKTHLVNELEKNPDRITTLSNPFDFENIQLVKRQNNFLPTLSIIGRTTSQKGQRSGTVVKHCIRELLNEIPELSLKIIGGSVENLPIEIQKRINDFKNEFPGRISIPGFLEDLQQVFSQSSVVIASGRIAVESIASGVPTIALGESGYFGLVTSENFNEAVKSNFGDSSESYKKEVILDFVKIKSDLINVFTNNSLNENINNQKEELIKKAKNHFDIESIASSIFEIYLSERMRKIYPKYIPTLLYHQVADKDFNSKHKIFVKRQVFEKQLKTLNLRGYKTITFKDYNDFKYGRTNIKDFPRKPIVLTFDDGYEDNYLNLLPLMKKYKMKCVVFALGNRSIKENIWDVAKGEISSPLLNDFQLKEMHKYGIEIGVHSLSHAHLIEISNEQLYQEINEAKINLETLIGEEIITFSYPWGDYNEKVINEVKKAGFKYAVATDNGGLTWEDGLFSIFRPNIFKHNDIFTFIKKSSPWYRLRFFKKYGR